MSRNALRQVPTLLEGFISRLRKTRAQTTATAYEKIARAFVERFSDAGPFELNAIEDFITAPEGSTDRYAVTTRNHRLAALKALAKYAIAMGAWASDPTGGLEFAKEPPRDPAVLSVGEVQRLFFSLEALSSPNHLARDRAMLAVLFTLGLRVHELVGLDVDQVDFMDASLIGVRGKGATVHDLPVEPATLRLVAEWLLVRGARAKPSEAALFVSRRGTRLSTRAIQRLFQKLRALVGTRKKITPHTARHSAATLAIMGGADISSVGELLRHADINVTRRYIRLVDTRKRQVTELLSRVIPPALRAPSARNRVPAELSDAHPEASRATPEQLRTAEHRAFPAEHCFPAPANDNAKNTIDGKGPFLDVG